MAELKEDKKRPWKRLSNEAFKLAYHRMAHFSVKAVNSNASAGGVRVIELVELPYISVSTIGPLSVPMDYLINGAHTTATNQINSVVLDTLEDRYKNIEKDDVAFIRQMINQYDYCDHTGEIDCHLKQVIMPDQDGNDLCCTPLHSAGLSRLINDTERTIAKTIDETKFSQLRHAIMNYGGSNTQNIGGLANELRKPLFFLAPEEDMDFRKSLAIHYQGFSYLSPTLVDEYLDWFDKVCEAGKTKTMHQKLKEEQLLRAIVKYAFHESDRQFAYLMQNINKLPDEQLLNNELNSVFHGLIHEDQRTNDWFIDFGNAVSAYIKNKPRRRNINGKQEDIHADINNQDAITLQSIISDIARTFSTKSFRSAL